MLTLSKYCRNINNLANTKQIVSLSRKSIKKSGISKSYEASFFGKLTQCNNLKTKIFLRSTQTTPTPPNSYATNKSTKTIGYWLLTCSGAMSLGILLGGVTRLTDSGLSLINWELLGEKTPQTEMEWEEQFKKYQQLSKQIKNKELNLSEYKYIWHMEHGHIQWSKAIGACFFIPAVYFWTKGRLASSMKMRVVFLGALLGLQGFTGWYLGKSILQNRSDNKNNEPKFSQYRLASHLALGYFIQASFLWSALHHLWPAERISTASGEALRASGKFRWLAHMAKGLVFTTAVSGAFMAALNAGLIYNSFPKMADKWIPDDIWSAQLRLANITENPTTVQFAHRVLGISTLSYVTYLCYTSRKRILPPRAYRAAAVLAIFAYLQVALGIASLLNYVPTDLAISHQSGSLALLSAAIWLSHELRKLKR